MQKLSECLGQRQQIRTDFAENQDAGANESVDRSRHSRSHLLDIENRHGVFAHGQSLGGTDRDVGTPTKVRGMAPTVSDLLARDGQSFSFEFFPPKTDEGEQALWRAIGELESLRPTFVSMTYGAGGSTRDRTVRLTERIASETSLVPVGHLTCVGASDPDLREVVAEYRTAGVRNILALRGDPRGGPGAVWEPHPDGLNYARDLVQLIHEVDDFCVGVAAFPDPHPASGSHDIDSQVLLSKEQAGASFAVTQFFFDPASYDSLVGRARAIGCTIPIIPGIMPVTNLAQIERFSVLSGAAFPRELADRFRSLGDNPAAVRALGVEVASEMCGVLLEHGAPGLHFYTLNRSTATREIFANLGLASTTG